MTDPVARGDPEDYVNAMAGEPTELAPSSSETMANTAWALDDGPEWEPPFWTPARITAVAVGVAVGALVVATGLAGYHLRAPAPAAAPASTTSTVPTVASTTITTNTPPPTTTTTTALPSTATTTALPSTATQTVTVSAAPVQQVRPTAPYFSGAGDRAFLANLQNYGWTIYNPQMLIARGHEVCNLLQSGMSVAQVKSRMAEYAATEPTIPDPYLAADNVVYAALYAYEPCFTR